MMSEFVDVDFSGYGAELFGDRFSDDVIERAYFVLNTYGYPDRVSFEEWVVPTVTGNRGYVVKVSADDAEHQDDPVPVEMFCECAHGQVKGGRASCYHVAMVLIAKGWVAHN